MTWQRYNHQHWQQFMQTANNPLAVQFQLLQSFIQKNIYSKYGQQFHFSKIKNYIDYKKYVPIIEDWSHLQPYIQSIANGEDNILTSEKVLGFEATSGSTFQSKWIPFTSSFQKSFEKAVAVWIYDLYRSRPEVFAGPAFWSVSPVLKSKKKTNDGLPIGLDNDLAYFQPEYAMLVASSLLPIPEKVFHHTKKELFYQEVLAAMFASPTLSFISFWSPTFFLMLDTFLRNDFDLILKKVTENASLKNERLAQIKNWNSDTGTWKQLWPRLACLSCWTDAQSATYISKVQKQLGDIFIQPKGLVATEGIYTLPLANGDRVPAFHSHFFEYRHIETKEIHLINELKQNESYEVIVTNGSGLYRYATKDVVKVVGQFKALPILEFQGRLRTYDLVGEKLSETQIVEALETLKKHIQRDAFLSWEKDKYVVFIIKNIPEFKASEIAEAIQKMEKQLCQNPYYQQALNTGQLKSLQWKTLTIATFQTLIKKIKMQKQIRDGDFKPLVCVEPNLVAEIANREQLLE